jgi:p-aminobenzoyl-glutamate transporter AbgT
MEYIAGSCNIGKGEVRRRQIVALIGLILVISTTAGLIGSDSAKSARFSVFVPALVFAVGFIQSRRKFCFSLWPDGNI